MYVRTANPKTDELNGQKSTTKTSFASVFIGKYYKISKSVAAWKLCSYTFWYAWLIISYIFFIKYINSI